MYLLPHLHLEICQGEVILPLDRLVVRQDKEAVVVVLFHTVVGSQSTTRLLLHVLQTLRLGTVGAVEVGVIPGLEGLEVVRTLDQVVVAEDMEALVVAVDGQESQINQVD